MDIPNALSIYEVETVEVVNPLTVVVTFTNGDSISLEMARLKELALSYPLEYVRHEAEE